MDRLWVGAAVGAAALGLTAATVLPRLDLETGAGQSISGSRGHSDREPSGTPAPSPRTPPVHAPGRVLVVAAEGAGPRGLERVAREINGRGPRRIPGSPVHVVRLPPEMSVDQAVRRFEHDPSVEYAEPDYLVTADDRTVPGDPAFGQLWGLDNTGQTGGTPDADIDAAEAWAWGTGSAGVTVAVIDTGVDIGHPDLQSNIWRNRDEVAGNRVDDDRNGYVDDVHGWDFANDDRSVYDGPDDDHGTHVAGTIAAAGDNDTGVTGVAWRARVMPLKFLGPNGGHVSDAIAALSYAVDNGARVSNNSWGGAGHSRALRDAIAAAGAQGHVFVTSAGNGGDDQVGDDLAVVPSYPASYAEPSIISVAATDHHDSLAPFSNYGDREVDLAAPGVQVYSTLPGGRYGSYSGTSMAAPHVTGVAALLLAERPGATGSDITMLLTSTVDRLATLSGAVGSGGRLNAASLVQQVQSGAALSATPATLRVGSPTSLTVTVTQDGQPLAGRQVVLEQRPVGQIGWTRVPGGDGLVTDTRGAVVQPASPDRHTDYLARVPGLPGSTSPVSRVLVRPVLTNTTSTGRLRAGRQRVIAGTLSPEHTGSVTVVVRRNGRTVLRQRASLTGSAYRLDYRPRRPGRYVAFARWAGDGDHLSTTSPRRAFRAY